MEKRNRITTITLNPAIDTLYRMADFKLGTSNRSGAPIRTAGGKGLNVTRVIRQLGEEVTATGFLGGNSGLFIQSELQRIGVNSQFVEIEEETRTCLAFVDSTGTQTEVLENGPTIHQKELACLNSKFTDILAETDILVLSGSLPKSLTSTVYQYFLQMAMERQVKVLLDTSGQTLHDCLSCKPFMIKPNLEELEQLLDKKLGTELEIWEAINHLKSYDIPLIIVSNGAKGAFASFFGKRYYIPTAKIKAVSAVGSGDSFVAGIAVGLAKNLQIEEILSLASACGTANAAEVETGHIQLKNVERFQKQITIQEIC